MERNDTAQAQRAIPNPIPILFRAMTGLLSEPGLVGSENSCGLPKIEFQEDSEALASLDGSRRLSDTIFGCRKQDEVAFCLGDFVPRDSTPYNS